MHTSHYFDRPRVGNAARTSLLRGLWRRMLRSLGIGLGLVAASLPAFTQASTHRLPQHWISYANLASKELEASLSDAANATVVLLHAWMEDRMLKKAHVVPPPVIVDLWVAPDGEVERVTFASLGEAQADDYLRTLLMAQTISKPPPRDMRQPMVLQFTLTVLTAN